MATHIDANRDSQTVYVRLRGTITDEDVLACAHRLAEMYSEGVLDNTWIEVVDASEVTDLGGVTTEGLRRIASASPWPPETPRIFIAPADISFGIARMYEMLVGDRSDQILVVRSEEEAMARIQQLRDSS